MTSQSYPYLQRFSSHTGIPEKNLVSAFKIEAHYHNLILEEQDPAERRRLYAEMYAQVHPLYNKTSEIGPGKSIFVNIVKLLHRELYGKSVLDIGCGSGAFLIAAASALPMGRLVGMDTSSSILPADVNEIQFIAADIVDFDVDQPFDVVFSHHVLEHIAPMDIKSHLASVENALVPGGKFIIFMPNRLFGPSDVTRIKDFTNTNRMPAMGSHVNELSYSETISLLDEYGFTNFKTVLPIPRIKYWFPNFRMSPSLLTYIERKSQLLNLLYHVRFGYRCIARLDVTLICQKAKTVSL